jgi:S1-C subfamily serine protease
MNCPNCNKPISPEDRFCGNCGYDLKTKENITDNEPQDDLKNLYIVLLIFVVSFILAGFLANIFTSSQNQHPEQQSQSEEIINTFSEEINQGNIAEKEQIVENKQPICEPPNIFCNNRCWTPCPKGERFVCSSKGDAYCEPEDKNAYENLLRKITQKQQVNFQNIQTQNEPGYLDVSKYVKSVAKIICPLDENGNRLSLGTGFISNASGYILTNYHVVDGAYKNECFVFFTDDFRKPPSKMYLAYVANNYNAKLDYATLILVEEWDDILKQFVEIKNRNFSPIPACNSDIVNIGDPILILGYPSYGGETLTVTNGIISGSLDEFYFKTDAKIDKGNSGAPVLLDDPSKDCYIGIATFLIKGGAESLGCILKTKYIKGYTWSP